MTGKIVDPHLAAIFETTSDEVQLAGIVDTRLRSHFQQSKGHSQLGIEGRSHDNRSFQIGEVLTQCCGMPPSLVSRLVKRLIEQHNEDDFYNGALENLTELRSSLTTFWPQLDQEAQEQKPLQSEIANRHCADALTWATKLCQEQGLPLVKVIEPGRDPAIYRARRDDDGALVVAVWNRPTEVLSAPPPERARAQRLSAAGEPYFYGGTSIETCLAELRLQNGWLIVIGRFAVCRTIRLLDLTVLPRLRYAASLFADDYVNRTRWTGILRGVTSEISRPSWPGDNERAYRATQYFATHVRTSFEPRVDGIAYPSSQCPGESWNIALFDGAAATIGDNPILKLHGDPFFARATCIRVDYETVDVARPASLA